ncbi:MAG: hypothetical protein IIB36_09840 [Gemmatimonadetes bacterium]|nr:hypothetical protein [Gemmatimonadota bacterium]
MDAVLRGRVDAAMSLVDRLMERAGVQPIVDADPAMRHNGQLMLGGVPEYQVGLCSDQTAALASVMREVGRRFGFDVRVIHGRNIGGGGHNFMTVRLANGTRYLMDPSRHGQDAQSAPWSALENIDFSTFDSRWWPNREINRWGEPVSHPITLRGRIG